MCETNVYIDDNGKEQLYLEDVDIIRPEDGKVFMKNIFGEQRTFEGFIKEISLARHKVVLKR